MATIKGLWVFKEKISLSSAATATVNWSNYTGGISYTGFKYSSGYLYCMRGESTQGTFYNSTTNKFSQFSHRMIYFGENAQTVPDSFDTWFRENAIHCDVAELTGTLWQVLTGWSINSGYDLIKMPISGLVEGFQNDAKYPTEPMEFQSFNLGYNSSNTATVDYVNFNNGEITYKAPDSTFNVYFSGNTGATNKDQFLIAWLTAYGILTEVGEEAKEYVSVLYDSNVIATLAPNQEATLHCADNEMTTDITITTFELPSAKLQEKTITANGEVIPYSELGYDGFSKVSVNVPVPDGYIVPTGTKEITENGTSDVTEFESIDVNVQPPTFTPYNGKVIIKNLSDIISFTVNGVVFQAEKEMTWKQWCESSYNTQGAYILLGNGVNAVRWSGSGRLQFNAVALNDTLVLDTDIIVNSTEYSTKTATHGGGGAN